MQRALVGSEPSEEVEQPREGFAWALRWVVCIDPPGGTEYKAGLPPLRQGFSHLASV